MNLTNIPTLIAVPFASGAGAGYRNTIPVPSQIPTTPGAASFTDGFPPVTFQPIASGGVPPYGADVNGILYALSFANRWEQAGGRYYYDSAFSTAIAGYPKGAILNRSDNLGAWINTQDGNTTDPDSAGAFSWLPMRANAVAISIAVSAGANGTTRNQLGSQVIVCTGSIASAATLILPLIAGSVYVVRNNTTGAGTLTIIGTTGSGVTIPQTVGYFVYTDGVNFYGSSADVSGLYLPVGGTAVAATKLAAARNFSLSGVITAPNVAFDGTGNLDLVTAIADGALSIDKTSGLQTALDAKAPSVSPQFSGNVGVGTNPTSVPGIGNPVAGSNNIVVYNAGNIGIAMLTDSAATRTQQYAFGAAGIGAADGGMFYDTASRNLVLKAGGGTINTAANINTSGAVIALYSISQVWAMNGSGTLYMRPNGTGSTVGQATLDTSGTLSLPALAASGAITGASLAATGAITSSTVHASSTIMAAGGFQIG